MVRLVLDMGYARWMRQQLGGLVCVPPRILVFDVPFRLTMQINAYCMVLIVCMVLVTIVRIKIIVNVNVMLGLKETIALS